MRTAKGQTKPGRFSRFSHTAPHSAHNLNIAGFVILSRLRWLSKVTSLYMPKGI